MITSLFGDLGVSNKSGTADRRPDGTVESDGGFAATAILETNAAEVNERGQIVDRHLRDLFVTGSPAQAMREHFATSRAELEHAGKWIVLLDPARIWASAVIKGLSDASGQPIERLHLREHGTLRTLAMVERTAIVRRLDDTLKVYHADVRATGHENAEISLALMERAHMTAVIVGPMQPHAIDAMLNTLYDAASQPTWRCPTLMFLLPPGAVWIGNKISGIAWPNALRVQILSEPLTGTSSVWNAVLGMWNHVKEYRPYDTPKAAAAGGEVAEGEFPIKVADLLPQTAAARSVAGPVTITPAEIETTSSRPNAPLDMQRATSALAEMLRTDGLLGCAVVESATGMVLVREQRDALPVDLDVVAAACAHVLRGHRLAARSMGLGEHVEEVMVGAGNRQQVIRVLSRHPELFMFALLDKSRTNLALARFRLLEAEKNLV